jgi:beta-phosphoglucomutase-like phosphatase (HAD superfamily)
MTFKAAFFDMDGLFLDSEPQWHLSQQEICARYGYSWDDDDQRVCIGGPLSRVGDYISERCAHDMTGLEVVSELTEMMLVKLSSNAILMPGAFAAVNRVREIMPVALVSASPRNLMDAALSTLPSGFFSFTISADDVERTKPFPDPYLLAAKRMNESPNECVVFEDSLTGVSSALDAGCSVIAVPHYVDVIDSQRVRVIQTLEKVDSQMLSDFYSAL